MPYVQPTPDQMAATNIGYALDHLHKAQNIMASVTSSVISDHSTAYFSANPDENQRKISLYTQAVVDLQDMRDRLVS